MENALMKIKPVFSSVPYIDCALQRIYDSAGNIEINKLIADLEISERNFRRQFKKIVGIRPKQYCKVIQFNSAFEAIQTGNEDQIYNLALNFGYYDHAHFINDFKSFLGQSPQRFLKSDHKFLKNYLGSKNFNDTSN